MKVVTRIASVVAGVLAAVSTTSASEQLPRPEALEPAVDFWQRVYTEIDSNHGFIHDREVLGRVYDKISLPRDLLRSEERHQLKEASERVEATLLALAEQSGEPETDFQRQVREEFGDDVATETFREAADQLRFQRGLSDRFRAGYKRSGRWYDHIRETLKEHDVPAALAALPHVESSYRTQVTSHAWAVGLWQFTRLTATDYIRVDRVVDSRRDPWRATEAAATYLAHAYDELGDWGLAITAYNHGITGMKRAVKRVGERSIARVIESYEGRNFGFASRNFYPAFLAAVDVDANATEHFGDIQRADPPELVEVPVPDYTEASALVEALPVSESRLQELNPALRDPVWSGRKYVPEGYRLRLPGDNAEGLADSMEQIALTRRYTDQRPDRKHRVRAGQTLSGIAQRYGVDMNALTAANDLHDQDYLRQGQVLRLPVAGKQPVSLAAKRGKVTGSYTVQAGDTLSEIAARHGISVETLAEINGIEDARSLRAGDTLEIRKQASLSQADG